MAPTDQSRGRRVVRVDLQCLSSEDDRLAKTLFGEAIALRQRPQIVVVGVEAFGRLARSALDLRQPQPRFDRTDDAGGDLILQVKDVIERAIETVGPDVIAGDRVDQLPGDAHPVAGFAYRAFEQIAHAQFARHLLHVDRFAFVEKARIACDHKQPGQPGNRRRDLLDHAIRKILLLRVARHVLKRQHRQ